MARTNSIPTKQDNPYECQLPGGGVARFWKTVELSPRRSRELGVYTSYLYPKLQSLKVAKSVMVAGETASESDVLNGIPVGLSLQDTRQLFEMNDVAAFAYLKSWTLKTGGESRPLPTSADAMQDLPPLIYSAISSHVAKLMNSAEADFSVDSIEDPESPTGA